MTHYNNNQHNNNQDDFVDVDDYNSATGYPLQQRMTPQQQRQEERRRHAEASSAAAAAAGSGASPWLNKQKKKSSKWKTIAWSVLVILILAVAGVLAWYFAVYKKNNASGGSNNSNNNGNTGGGGTVPATGPTVVGPNGTVLPNTNYPLKKVFYGMAYVPLGAQLPGCYNSQQTVDDELALLVQTTSRVRLYGTDCKVLEYVLNSIERKKLDLKVVVGIWIDKDNTTYTRQMTDFFKVMETYSWNNILGVSVGNEVLFDKYQSSEFLLSAIAEVKAKVVALGHKDLPVFSSDLESFNTYPLTSNEDRAGVNLHPFFSGIPIDQAAAWYWKYLKENVTPKVNVNRTAPIDIWITEVGWPTFPATAAVQGSVPSIPNLQIFLDTWLCEANKNGMPYYYFEFFDAPWKIWPGSAVEGFWGLMTIDKKLKVKLPDCLI
ncbi:glycoside hydrolase family 17 protein [Linnemannia elongata AG-77]|uniref:glucan endo-1,3-beta-D-glucosidase n=1 Tax=Linnemannia elongata AG-77 TaxID=1314771 RepID=A0A197KCV0_9FUNG|nr:glycoside hydrolase family 17 protein [Linnemannia elongata AG-77]